MSESQQHGQHHAFRSSLAHRASGDPRTLSPGEVLFLQRTLGNRAVTQLFQQAAHPPAVSPPPSVASPEARAMIPPPLASVFPLQQKERGQSGVHPFYRTPKEVIPHVGIL